jgi:hypothetical protein
MMEFFCAGVSVAFCGIVPETITGRIWLRAKKTWE